MYERALAVLVDSRGLLHWGFKFVTGVDVVSSPRRLQFGENGFNVPTGDVQDMVEQAESILRIEALAQAVSERALGTCVGFTLDVFVFARVNFDQQLIECKLAVGDQVEWR